MKKALWIAAGLLLALWVIGLYGCRENVNDRSSSGGASEQTGHTLRYVCEPEDAGLLKGMTEYMLGKGQSGGYITVIPKDGFDFVGWSDGELSNYRGEDKLHKNKDTVIVAKFEQRPYELHYVADSPIGGVLYGETSQKLREGELSSTVTAVPNAYYSFAGWSDGRKDYSRTNDSIHKDTTITAIFVRDEISVTVPNLYITTEDGRAIKSKTEYKSGVMSITDAEKDEYNLSGAAVQLKGRGNSSWSSSAIATPSSHKSKNSYTIKLDEKERLLGMGKAKAKTWILNSGKYDESGLRNWICWRLGELMDGINFSIESRWVHLYINGEYRGVYLLTEKVEVNSARIDIETEDTSVLDKGYLLQIDKRELSVEGHKENWDYFLVDGYFGDGEEKNLRPFVIENSVESEAQVHFIKDYVGQCHDAIMSGKEEKIRALIDVDSFMDMFLIEELAKDVDANFASFYMYKAPGGKLCLTSPWDFDFGMGTYSSAMTLGDLMCEKTIGNLWLKSLMKTDWFPKALQKRMDEVKPLLTQVKDEMWAMEPSLTEAYDKNDEKWNIYGNAYADYVAGQVSSNLTSYHEHVQYLSDWMDDRWELMTGYIDEYAAGHGSLQK